jgi:hypothetical protein
MNSGRSVGVHIPKGQREEASNHPPGTVVGFTPLQFFGVDVVNSKGRVQRELYFITSEDKVFVAPDSSAWFAGASHVGEKMEERVLKLLAKSRGASATPETVPADQLDVLDGG